MDENGTGGNPGGFLRDVTEDPIPVVNYQSEFTWTETPCSCSYTGMHTWAGHWFRLFYTRRVW